jgi:HlyD family secretion protein
LKTAVDEIMPDARPGFFSAHGWSWVAIGLPVIVLAAWEPVSETITSPEAESAIIQTATVERADLTGEILVPGRVSGAQSTEIRCALERLSAAGQRGSPGGGASTILSLVPEGAIVQQGELLCELDASAYTELVSNQEIAVEQARTNRLQAALDLEVAQIALQAYREGEKIQAETAYLGQIALAKADLTRQSDRIAWLERMVEKGYASVAQLHSERLAHEKLGISLRRSEVAMENYRRFTAPKQLMMLQSQVIGAQATLGFQSIRLSREEERLGHYKNLVERCTIRAPHGGYVVYANRSGRSPVVYEGAPVRERMPLFTLPDQSKLEVEVLLHETIIERVRPGMAVAIRLEAFPDLHLSGVLSSVSPVPLSDRNPESGNDATYFLGHIQLKMTPQKLRPGITTLVTISTGLRSGVLAIPTKAVTVEHHQEICYVGHADSVERRAVKVTMASRDMLEVIDGLSEGEVVILNPAILASRASQ